MYYIYATWKNRTVFQYNLLYKEVRIPVVEFHVISQLTPLGYVEPLFDCILPLGIPLKVELEQVPSSFTI